jgi:HK97 family phage portal protein
MSVISWARERFAAAAPARIEPVARQSARVVSTWQEGKPLPKPSDYVALAGMVRRNVIAASCIWEIVTSAAEPELIVEQRKTTGQTDGQDWARVPDGHELATLLADPNPDESQDELLERLLTHQQIGGQWALHKARSSSGRLVELWALRPDRLETVPGDEGLVAGYLFKTDKKKTPIPTRDAVICMLRADPLDDFYGLSPLAVLALFGDLDNKAADYLRSFFYNGGAPAGLLKIKNAILEEPDRIRLKEAWAREHGGTAGWHSVSVVDADADYQEIGSRPEKLNMETIWDETEARICSAFGVPPILVGCNIGLKRATYANYGEARQSFWQETMPLVLNRTARKLTKGVAHEWGTDLRVRYELTNVKALQVDDAVVREQSVKEYEAGVITLNEARQRCGWPAVEGPDGDARKAPAPEAPPGPGAPGVPPEPDPDAGLLEQQYVDLLTRLARHERHAAPPVPGLVAKRQALKAAAGKYFARLGPDLVAHLQTKLAEVD